jgi:hypothetical protein
LCWKTSDCTAARFQEIAARHFLHRAHTHQLITRQERAADAGIRAGSCVGRTTLLQWPTLQNVLRADRATVCFESRRKLTACNAHSSLRRNSPWNALNGGKV